MALKTKLLIFLSFSSFVEYLSARVKIDEKVEFTVQQILTTDLPPTEALSKATIIVFKTYLGSVGTQRIFPFFAII